MQLPLAALVWGVNQVPPLVERQDFLNQQSDLIKDNRVQEVDVPKFFRVTGEVAGFSLAVHVFSSLVGTLPYMATALVVQAGRQRRQINHWQALRQALTRWPAALITLFILDILLFGLFLLFIVPGIVFLIYWTFAIQAVILSGKTGWSALTYSMNVVNRRWWRVLGFSLVFGIMAMAISLLISAINLRAGNFITDVGFAAATRIALAFFIVAYTVFFFNLDETKIIEAHEGLSQ